MYWPRPNSQLIHTDDELIQKKKKKKLLSFYYFPGRGQ